MQSNRGQRGKWSFRKEKREIEGARNRGTESGIFLTTGRTTIAASVTRYSGKLSSAYYYGVAFTVTAKKNSNNRGECSWRHGVRYCKFSDVKSERSLKVRAPSRCLVDIIRALYSSFKLPVTIRDTSADDLYAARRLQRSGIVNHIQRTTFRKIAVSPSLKRWALTQCRLSRHWGARLECTSCFQPLCEVVSAV